MEGSESTETYHAALAGNDRALNHLGPQVRVNWRYERRLSQAAGYDHRVGDQFLFRRGRVAAARRRLHGSVAPRAGRLPGRRSLY